MSVSYTLAELAGIFDVELAGDGGCRVERVADLRSAGPGCIAFLNNRRYKLQLRDTQAEAVILREADAADCPRPALVTGDPYALYAKVAALLHPDEDLRAAPGIHPSAIVADTAEVADDAIIGPRAVLEEGARVGRGSFVGPGCVLRKRAVIGERCKLTANITLCSDCRLGDRVIVHPSAVIGSDGFGFANESGRWIKIPQLGAVVVGDDVEIGAGVTVDRGALNDTVIENGVKLDNQVHVAHNVTIGAHTAIAAQSGIAGSTVIGRHCAIGGSVGILGHLAIADKTQLYARSLVTKSIKSAGDYGSGTPLEPTVQWRRNRARMKQLDEMAKRIRSLEKRLIAMEERGHKE